MPGGQRSPAPEGAQIIHVHANSRKEELAVERQTRVSGAEDESITGRPGGIGWVVSDVVSIQQIGDRRQRHRCSGVAIADRLHGVHRQSAQVGDGLAVVSIPGQRGRLFGGRRARSHDITLGEGWGSRWLVRCCHSGAER